MKKTLVFATAIILMSQLVLAQTKARQPVRKKATGSLAEAMADGKMVYMKYCVTCHQADGAGVPNMNPPLIKTTYVLGDKVKLIQIVLNGFKEDVEINGQTYSNNMPPHDFLQDKEIADVLTYVRHSFTNKASAIKTADVTPLRATIKK